MGRRVSFGSSCEIIAKLSPIPAAKIGTNVRGEGKVRGIYRFLGGGLLLFRSRSLLLGLRFLVSLQREVGDEGGPSERRSHIISNNA